MRKILSLTMAVIVAFVGQASALTQSSIPPKFPFYWGSNAGAAYIRSIPTASQIGIVNCAASLPDGFPPLTFLAQTSGGCPPFGQDMNGILRQITQWQQWQQAGELPTIYDSSFQTSIGGYPNGAIIQSAIVPGDFWISTVDNNTTNPDNGGAGWSPAPSAYATGDVKWNWSTSASQSGWVVANSTIGNASSGANLASSTTQLLFIYTWNNCSNTLCPVSTGRGANAAADYAANKTILVLSLAGTMLVGNDQNNGILSGVPVISGSGINSNTSIIGETLHTITAAQLPSHTHSGTTGTESAPHTHSGSGTTASENASHTHQSNYYPLSVNEVVNVGGSAYLVQNSFSTSTTTGESANHQHTYSFTTSSESASHTHSFTTDGCGACAGSAENNTPRAMVGYWMIKL